MYRPNKTAAILALLIALGACGGRVAQVVETERPFDAALTCEHLQAEHDNNMRRLKELVGEKGDSARDSVGMALILQPWFIDGRGAVGKEMLALNQRNARLEKLSAEKNCAPDPSQRK